VTEIIGRCIEMCNEAFHYLYFMSDMIDVNKSRAKVWAGNIAGIGNDKNLH
jgi:hypothetical protein